jgi:NhaP-type Na+/H+ or K+/H+ antiporter
MCNVTLSVAASGATKHAHQEPNCCCWLGCSSWKQAAHVSRTAVHVALLLLLLLLLQLLLLLLVTRRLLPRMHCSLQQQTRQHQQHLQCAACTAGWAGPKTAVAAAAAAASAVLPRDQSPARVA